MIKHWGAPPQETTSEEESFQPPAYEIKKQDTHERGPRKLLNYKIPKITRKQDLSPKPMPSPKKQHRETLSELDTRNFTSDDQSVDRLLPGHLD